MLVQLMRRFQMLMWLSKVDASQVISLKFHNLRVVAPPQRRRFAGSGGRAWLRKNEGKQTKQAAKACVCRHAGEIGVVKLK